MHIFGPFPRAARLAGGSDASNTDPHATEPAEKGKWVDTGPHIMIFNAGEAGKNYPQQGDDPDTIASGGGAGFAYLLDGYH